MRRTKSELCPVPGIYSSGKVKYYDDASVNQTRCDALNSIIWPHFYDLRHLAVIFAGAELSSVTARYIAFMRQLRGRMT